MLVGLWKDESATATVEYALLTAVLVGAGIAAWMGLKGAISSAMENIATTFSGSGG